jgi:hypothetical protein
VLGSTTISKMNNNKPCLSFTNNIANIIKNSYHFQ